MLVLDTATMPVRDRAEAFQSCVSLNCTTSVAVFEDPDRLDAEMTVFDLGPAKVFNIEATGTTLTRTPRMSRAMNDCPIALALPVRSTNHLTRDRDERAFGADDLMLVDLSAPYVYGWSGAGASYAFHVDYDQLGIPMDTIRRASGELRRSPLYALVRNHVRQVMTEAQRLVESGTASHVGAASVELMHALVVSAGDDAARARDALHHSMGPRVQAYVRQHLREPDLGAQRIATANGISVRTLYKVYESLGISLEQSIIEQRLSGARADLAAPRQHRTIAAVARAWGFTSPSFFTSKFRQAYGVTPRQWQAGATAGPDRAAPALDGAAAGR